MVDTEMRKISTKSLRCAYHDVYNGRDSNTNLYQLPCLNQTADPGITQQIYNILET